GRAVSQCVVKLNRIPYGNSVTTPADSWCVRSSPFAPLNRFGLMLSAGTLMKSPSWVGPVYRESEYEMSTFKCLIPGIGLRRSDLNSTSSALYIERPPGSNNCTRPKLGFLRGKPTVPAPAGSPPSKRLPELSPLFA